MEDARDGGKSPAQGQARESEQKRLPSLWTFGIVPAEQVKLDPRKLMEMHYELEGQAFVVSTSSVSTSSILLRVLMGG
jgi:hypothetical protein